MMFIAVYSDGSRVKIPAVNNRSAIIVARVHGQKKNKILVTVTPEERL